MGWVSNLTSPGAQARSRGQMPIPRPGGQLSLHVLDYHATGWPPRVNEMWANNQCEISEGVGFCGFLTQTPAVLLTSSMGMLAAQISDAIHVLSRDVAAPARPPPQK